jgi:hypothetical protein
LTRRVVEDLDLISEISRIRQALVLKRKIHVDIHGSIHGCGYPSTAVTATNTPEPSTESKPIPRRAR